MVSMSESKFYLTRVTEKGELLHPATRGQGWATVGATVLQLVTKVTRNCVFQVSMYICYI